MTDLEQRVAEARAVHGWSHTAQGMVDVCHCGARVESIGAHIDAAILAAVRSVLLEDGPVRDAMVDAARETMRYIPRRLDARQDRAADILTAALVRAFDYSEEG